MDDVETNSNRYGGDAIWLVKSGDRITGPFSTEEVKTKLRSKEIVVIDELSSPLSRWRYVRDEPAFSVVVEEIRTGQMHSREDTEIQGHHGTKTDTRTDADFLITIDDEIRAGSGEVTSAHAVGTEDLAAAQASASNSDVASPEYDHVVDAEYIEENSHGQAGQRSRSGDDLQPTRQFGMGPTPDAIRKESSRFTMLIWTAVFLILGILAYSVLHIRGMRAGSKEQLTTVTALIEQAERSWSKADFDEALSYYSDANTRSPKNPSIVPKLAVLMIKKGGTVEAKRLLLDLPNLNSLPQAQFETDMALGFAALAADDLSEAQARFRVARDAGKSGSYTKETWKADFNLGALAYLTKDLGEAISILRQARPEPPSQLLLARALILNSVSSPTRENDLKDAAKVLDSLLAQSTDFRQEALLLSAHVYQEQGDKKEAQTRMRMVYEMDPEQTANHFHSPFLNLAPLEWDTMVSICEELSIKMSESIADAVYALCLHKGRDRSQATRYLDDELARNSADSVLQSMKAYFLQQANRDEDAKGAVKMANRDGGSRLAHLTLARTCMRLGDQQCAEGAWQALISEYPTSLAGLTGLAQLRVAQGDQTEAANLVSRALSLAPRYVPALRLRQEIEAP